jgi:hypothetical protein
MRSRSCSKRSRRASQSSGQSNPSRQTWSISWMRFGAASRRAVRLHQARRRAARQLLAVHLKKPNIQSGKRRGVPDELSCRKTALNDAQHRWRSSRWRYRGTQNDNGASELDEPFSDGEQSSLIRGWTRLGWLGQVTLPHMLCSRLALTWDYPSPCAPPQMTKSLISFPANLEMVNNEPVVCIGGSGRSGSPLDAWQMKSG